MGNPLDRFLNSITMYRLLLYGLATVLLASAGLGWRGALPFSAGSILGSALLLSAVCYASNWLLAKAWGVATNAESSLITGLILACVLRPLTTPAGALALVAAALLAMLSKYVLAAGRKHILNPAAAAAVIVGMLGLVQPYWWIGSASLLPVTLVFSLLILRKIRRFGLAGAFVVVSLAVSVWVGYVQGESAYQSLRLELISSPLIFLAGVMLTEPLTAPTDSRYLLPYGALVGLLYASQWQFGPFYSTPEMALVAGNLFAWAVSRKSKPLLVLKAVERRSSSLYELVFAASEPLRHRAGQYLELTLPGVRLDGRGNRRTFTVASSPGEPEVRFGISVPERPSSFKAALVKSRPGLVAGIGAVGGDFTLPRDTDRKLVFLAGGIGVTPFRSMAASIAESGERRDITLLQAVGEADEALYGEVFSRAGVRTVLVLGSKAVVPARWKGRVGRLTADMLQEEIADMRNSLFYVSGPPGFVDHCRALLKGLGVARTSVRSDYFPGY